jgi:[amino group carrier protein]-L-2-aminoadipate 6-kinase
MTDSDTLIVVKVGGGEGVNAEAVCADIAALVRAGKRIVLVHGTSAAANTLADQLQVPVQTLLSPSGHTSRYTNAETLRVFMLAALGQMNPNLVLTLQSMGVNAIGLSGADGRLMQAKRKEAVRAIDPNTGRQRIVRDDFTGKVETVNGSLLKLLCDSGYTPVVAPLALGEQCEPLNIDGDRAAAQLAGALNAQALVILSNVPGLLANFPDPASLVRQLAPNKLDSALELAGGRMKKKVLAAQEALAMGVGRIILADSRRENPVQLALQGEGTVISNG